MKLVLFMFDHAKVKRERKTVQGKVSKRTEFKMVSVVKFSGINIGTEDSKDSISKEISKICSVQVSAAAVGA